MKTLLIAFSLLLVSANGYSATPTEVGNIKASRFALTQKTLAQIDLLTPDTTGQMVLCNNCTTSPVCISSGSTLPGQWVILVATGAFVGASFSGLPHCR